MQASKLSPPAQIETAACVTKKGVESNPGTPEIA
jgi:hypothetical protein